MIFRNVAIVLLSLISIHSFGANINSNGTGGGDWSLGSSWLGGVVPGAGDQAFIVNGDNITVSSAASILNLILHDNNSTITINSGKTLTVSDWIYINATGINQNTIIVNNGIINCVRMTVKDFQKPNYTLTVSGTGTINCSDYAEYTAAALGMSISMGNKLIISSEIVLQGSSLTFTVNESISCHQFIFNSGVLDLSSNNAELRMNIFSYLSGTISSNSSSTSKVYFNVITGIPDNGSISWPEVIFSNSCSFAGNFTAHNATISSGASLNLASNELTLNAGNFTNSGTFLGSTGSKITLSGASAQTITSNSVIIIPNLEIANTVGGVSIASGSSNIQVSEQVSFDAVGTTAFTTNGKLVLLDTASGMANLGNLNNHTITGNITCQFKSNTLTNVDYRLMSMPVTGVTIADVQFNAGTQAGGFATYGFTGSNTPSAGGFFSSYTYNSASVATVFTEGFIGATGTGESMNHLIASTWYIGPWNGKGSSYNFKVTGSPNSGTVVINQANGARMTATGTGLNPEIDWALIGNPYPSTVTLTGAELVGIDPNVWQFKADGGGYVEDKTLPPFQGFIVFQTGGASSVTFNESNKVTTRKVFQKSSEKKDMVNIFITSEHTNKWSFASVQVKKGATNKYDIGLDAGRIINPNPWPNLALITEDSVASQRFYGDKSGGHLTIPVNTMTYKSGNHKLRFENVSDLKGCMVLEDMTLNKMIAIDDINNTYSFYLSDTVKKDRFKLHIYKFAKEITSSNASCFDKNDGMVELNLFDLGSDYFYELSDQSGKNIAIDFNAKGKQNIKNLEPGNYTFVIQSNGLTCPVSKEYFSILEPSEMKPDFGYKGNSTVFYNNKDIEFENKSLGGIATYLWDFGDKSFDSRETPTHIYTAPGIYTIMLTSQNGNADCDVSASRSINVIDAYLSVSELSDDNVEVIQLNDKLNVIAKSSFDEFKIVDLSGKLVLEGDVRNQNNFEINLSKLNGGIYILHLNGNEKPYTLKFYKK